VGLLAINFIYAINFPSLDLVSIQNAINWIEMQYYGSWSLWGSQPTNIANQKRIFLEWNLVAWYLADQYPAYVVGVIADGAPILEKTIGAGKGTSIKNRVIDVQEALVPLTSNGFGRRALQMLLGSTDRMTIYG
jgi:hypothetical protein